MNSILDSERFVSHCYESPRSRILYYQMVNAITEFPSIYYRIDRILYDTCKEFKLPMPDPPVVPKESVYVVCSYID